MTKTNLSAILQTTAKVFARSGMDNFSIRTVAKEVPITPSVLYHYAKNQDDLLRKMFEYCNSQLGLMRRQLPRPATAAEMLKQRIEFQIDNQELIVAVLKYYLTYRKTFEKFKNGFVPDKSALHIEEVLKFGIESGEFTVTNLEDDAKVITHAINGFLLEYFPYTPTGKEKEELIERISVFLLRALK